MRLSILHASRTRVSSGCIHLPHLWALAAFAPSRQDQLSLEEYDTYDTTFEKLPERQRRAVSRICGFACVWGTHCIDLRKSGTLGASSTRWFRCGWLHVRISRPFLTPTPAVFRLGLPECRVVSRTMQSDHQSFYVSPSLYFLAHLRFALPSNPLGV